IATGRLAGLRRDARGHPAHRRTVDWGAAHPRELVYRGAMDQFGRAVSRGFNDLAYTVGHATAGIGRLLADAIASADRAIHQVLPAAIPSWVVLAAVV